ncbi:MAG TPA: flagellar biosynthetic protein FliO [Silvibacterium sp.]|nr:flagellar biosynthetic protein FliO [Silvibacterium sp.]
MTREVQVESMGEGAASGTSAVAAKGRIVAWPAAWDWRRTAGEWWRRMLRLGGKRERRLRLCENLALGERRFVAVIEFEQSRFLVGGTPSSLVLLARFEHSKAPCVAASGAESAEEFD